MLHKYNFDEEFMSIYVPYLQVKAFNYPEYKIPRLYSVNLKTRIKIGSTTFLHRFFKKMFFIQPVINSRRLFKHGSKKHKKIPHNLLATSRTGGLLLSFFFNTFAQKKNYRYFRNNTFGSIIKPILVSVFAVKRYYVNRRDHDWSFRLVLSLVFTPNNILVEASNSLYKIYNLPLTNDERYER